VIRQGNACWGYNLESIYQKARFPTLLLLGLIALLIGLLSWMLVRTVRRQRLEEKRKQFALRTLTHELRTPVSSLLLSTETLKSQFDSLPGRVQESLLRIIDDTQRLARLTEASRRYLSSFEGRLVSLKPSEIPSLKELLSGLAEERGPGVSLDPSSSDAAMFQDTYWLSVCVGNLISNALAHGAPPVELKISQEGAQVGIGVRDGGKCVFRDLDEMAGPFRKSDASRGLGLGLSIVTQVAREMGGRLEYRPDPTEFTLWLPERRG
jgi:signal transduction histidine kinase